MLIVGDARHIPLADESVQCVVTSPPYWGLRDYGVDGQLGLEATPEDYVENMVGVFREVKRVLRDDGTLWLNLGDSYATGGHGGGGSFMEMRGGDGAPATGAWAHRKNKRGWRAAPPGLKAKDLVGIPWRVAFALQADGWYLRSDIIWSKPNPMPESVTDRPTKAHEYLFLMAKSGRYYYDLEAIREAVKPNNVGECAVVEHQGGTRFDEDGKPHGARRRYDGIKGANRRTVWTINTQSYSAAHFATFPAKLIEPCIKAGCPVGGIVFDPFVGSGTTVEVARSLGRQGMGLDISHDYLHDMASERIKTTVGMGF